jgi:polyisoprenyl-teichoic acid--peptidoglycan teichoic acid transferase
LNIFMKNLDSVTPKPYFEPHFQDNNRLKVPLPHPPMDSAAEMHAEIKAIKKSEQVYKQKKPEPKQDVSFFSVSNKALGSAKPKSRKLRLLKFVLSAIIGIILILGGMVALKASNISDKIFVGQKYSFFQKLKMAFVGAFGGGEILIGENLGQINILLLGIGGEGHEGPYLTDTMMVAQIRPASGEISLTSIPRDLLATLPENYGQRKINAAFAEGFNLHKNYNEAGKWALETVQKTIGLKIPYFAVVDFSGFEKAVDMVGGLDIYVENSFNDSMYPNENLGYLPTQTFTKGWEKMNGRRALIFARSRHGTNNEGSDFARSQRQEKIISSLKTKILQLNLITDSGKINSLLNTFSDRFHTNVSPGELFRLYGIVRDRSNQKILSLSLDEETGIICPKILEDSGAWVLTICEGKTDMDIWNFFKNSFELAKLKEEKAVVWLGTSTDDKTAFQKAFKDLRSAGFTVWEVGFGGKEPVSQNLIYQVNKKPYSAELIKKEVNAMEVNLPPPGIKIDPDKVDIIVILGENK